MSRDINLSYCFFQVYFSTNGNDELFRLSNNPLIANIKWRIYPVISIGKFYVSDGPINNQLVANFTRKFYLLLKLTLIYT